MINYVNSVISVRCLRIATAGHLDSVSVALFTLINGEAAVRQQGCSRLWLLLRGSDRGGAARSVQEAASSIFPHFTVAQSCNHEMKRENLFRSVL